jgi:transketolase
MTKLADHLAILLAEHARHDERIWVLDGDLADSDGACEFARMHPQRFLMAGIAEQNMVSMAAGMADCGVRPWVFSFAAFLCYRAYDQIRIGLSQSRQPVVLVASHAGGLAARNGKSHAAPNDLALMLSLPALDVWAPADVADTALALQAALCSPRATYIRMPRRQFGDGDALPGSAAPLRWIRPRAPLTLLSTGLASHWALDVADVLAQRGSDIGVLHCARLSPLPDLERVLAGVRTLAVLEDHRRFGGLASLAAQGLPDRPLHVFGWPDTYAGKSGSDDELRLLHGLDTGTLTSAIARLANPLHH